jgi:signal transduction histidine kinase
MGYLVATLGQGAMVCADLLLAHIVPTMAFPSALPLLLVALVALGWGAGPSLVATLEGMLLLDYVIVSPRHGLSVPRAQDAANMLLFLVVGGVISLVASRTAQARRDAQEANRRMDEFLFIVSHELRTPLSGIQGFVQLADQRVQRLAATTEGPGTEMATGLTSVHDFLVRTMQSVRRLTRLVSDMLDVSRIEAGQLELRLAPCDLRVVVQQAVDEHRLAWPTRSILLEAPHTAVPVQADADRLVQVVSNYLTNALKYSPPERAVHVTVVQEEGTACARVRDEGPGLSAEEQASIWERFHRVPGMAVRSGSQIGLGLGLYISRMLVEQHRGRVGVESQPGAGTTFWFALPLA